MEVACTSHLNDTLHAFLSYILIAFQPLCCFFSHVCTSTTWSYSSTCRRAHAHTVRCEPIRSGSCTRSHASACSWHSSADKHFRRSGARRTRCVHRGESSGWSCWTCSSWCSTDSRTSGSSCSCGTTPAFSGKLSSNESVSHSSAGSAFGTTRRTAEASWIGEGGCAVEVRANSRQCLFSGFCPYPLHACPGSCVDSMFPCA